MPGATITIGRTLNNQSNEYGFKIATKDLNKTRLIKADIIQHLKNNNHEVKVDNGWHD